MTMIRKSQFTKGNFLIDALLLTVLLIATNVSDEQVRQIIALEEHPKTSPVMFIENIGQWDNSVHFQIWGKTNNIVWLTEDAIWINITNAMWPADHIKYTSSDDLTKAIGTSAGVSVKLSFPEANINTRIEPFSPLETSINYFIGNNPEAWRSSVPVWGGVRYVNLYPGIDLLVTQADNRLTLQLDTLPGADLDKVRLHVEGASSAIVDGGMLHLGTVAGKISLPLLSTNEIGRSTMVQALGERTFEITNPFTPDKIIKTSFSQLRSGNNNPSYIRYSTFLGGGYNDQSYDSIVDEVGNIYVTGITGSPNFPTTPGVFDMVPNGNGDSFVVKLSPAGDSLIYATFLGGSARDDGRGIAVDMAGNAYIVGTTDSTDFPTTPDAFDTNADSLYVAKLNPAGSELDYATFIGGRGQLNNLGHPIAVDRAGSVYLTGYTKDLNFPTTPNAFNTSFNGGVTDAFVIKLNPYGSDLDYSTFLGGSGDTNYYDYYDDVANAIIVDEEGNAYVTGETISADFPTTSNAFDTQYRGGSDIFVVKLNPAGSNLVYATFLAGSHYERSSDIAVDNKGSVYVTGETYSFDFPATIGAFDTSFNGGAGDVFITKLNPDGSDVDYSTFLGGSLHDEALAISIDGSGNAYVTGEVTSKNFPTASNAFATNHNGGDYDVFIAKLSRTGNNLVYSTYLGGSLSDQAYAISVDRLHNVYVAGNTVSSDFPTTPDAFNAGINGANDAFVVKLAIPSTSIIPAVFKDN